MTLLTWCEVSQNMTAGDVVGNVLTLNDLEAAFRWGEPNKMKRYAVNRDERAWI
jgi:hypothetical protein